MKNKEENNTQQLIRCPRKGKAGYGERLRLRSEAIDYSRWGGFHFNKGWGGYRFKLRPTRNQRSSHNFFLSFFFSWWSPTRSSLRRRQSEWNVYRKRYLWVIMEKYDTWPPVVLKPSCSYPHCLLFFFFPNHHIVLQGMDIWVQTSSYCTIMKTEILITNHKFLDGFWESVPVSNWRRLIA